MVLAYLSVYFMSRGAKWSRPTCKAQRYKALTCPKSFTDVLPCSPQIYLCSHRAAANGVRDTSAKIIMETLGCDEETALQQLQSVKVARYLTDVF
jgi:hypothetical protein